MRLFDFRGAEIGILGVLRTELFCEEEYRVGVVEGAGPAEPAPDTTDAIGCLRNEVRSGMFYLVRPLDVVLAVSPDFIAASAGFGVGELLLLVVLVLKLAL